MGEKLYVALNGTACVHVRRGDGSCAKVSNFKNLSPKIPTTLTAPRRSKGTKSLGT